MYGHKEVVVVMGYGCHLTPRLREYLDQAAAYAKSNPRSIVFCTGGFTNSRTAPGVSEATLMAGYLRQQGVGNYILKEERSRTTTENIRHLRKYLLPQVAELERVVIFCDQCRSFKISWIFYHFFGFWPEIHSFDLAGRWQAKFIQYLYATPLDLLGLYLPSLEKFELLVRRISIGRK